jgi:hypothetical protein
MELIRTKRATSTAGANSSTGQPKSKYRKRSVSLLGLLQADSDSSSAFGLVSGQLLQANVTLVILERRLNGDEVQMEPEHFVMHADCVR